MKKSYCSGKFKKRIKELRKESKKWKNKIT